MSFQKFLIYKKSYLAGALLVAACVFLILMYANINVLFVCLSTFVILACLFAPLISEFNKSKEFYKSLVEYSNSISSVSDVLSGLSNPNDEVQELIFDFVMSYDKLCKQINSEAKSAIEDYCSYIESWVHEIKTPLSASVLIANRLDTSVKPELLNQFELINQELDEVLWYARSNSVSKDYRIRPVNLQDLLVGVCKKNARYLIEMGATPVFKESSNLQVYCDEKWTAFIITQAVINSAKYHAKNIIFSAEVKGHESFERTVVLSIKDDGDGIPESDVPFVFEPAFVGNRGRENTASTGMGLYLCAKLCKKLGIGISISSQEKIGTCVSLEFPFDETILHFCNKSVR